LTAHSHYRVMLVLHEETRTDAWCELAEQLTPEGGEIYLRGMVMVPEGQSLSEGALRAIRWRDTFRDIVSKDTLFHERVRVYVDYQPLRRIVEEIRELDINLLVTQWMGPFDATGGLLTDAILQTAPCDVVLVGSNWRKDDGPVLLSLRGGPNLTLGLHVAKALAPQTSITLFHAADTQRSAPDLERVMRFDPHIRRTVTAVSDITEGILHESADHSSIVLGARLQLPEASASASGPVVQRLYNQTEKPLILVRAWHTEALEFHPPTLLHSPDEDLSTRVDRWFAENTFHSREFDDVRQLLALKERQGVSISVGLPALNEEDTVGNVIHTLKTALMDDAPLVDEIVLIDSRSTDQTVAIAEAHGIPAYVHHNILPEMGANDGKGEALWKSLHVLKGDIIVWIDTDITNIHPRFVYGLLGPMLRRPHIQYVKGFYQRPIRVGDQLQGVGGGRVTELVARPLFNLFYPELSGIIQPLSGEYAGRRAALEQVPFFSGYGVETGLLLDLLHECGLDSIAQTDLEMRIHHNQSLVGLSKMSFAILQVFIARLEGRYGVHLLEKAGRSMKTIIYEPERFALEINNIGDVERPPMLSVPAYRERHCQ
jgi:glycosyltransferase involved in cell wall biosynthesis